MVRNVVFMDLNHHPPRTFLVRQLDFAVNSDIAGIVR